MQILKMLKPVYVKELDKAVPLLLQTKAGTRFHYEEKQLDIAVVGRLLLIGGTEEALATVRDISLSMLVDDVHAYKAWSAQSRSRDPAGYYEGPDRVQYDCAATGRHGDRICGTYQVRLKIFNAMSFKRHRTPPPGVFFCSS
ncbi:hypothetical protein LJK87_05160 [Paenibacillus sp. P25]|nr:hypothetical protein LJK87_05160 [Paenibacillus sp. P25]